MRTRTLALWSAVAVSVTLLACGSGSSVEESTTPADPTAPAAAKPSATAVAVGKTLTVKANGITADWTVTSAATAETDQYGTEPTSGGRWVLVHAKAAVKQGREVFVCGCDLSLIAASGKVYEQGFASFKGKGDLTGATVAAGQNADGWVIYDVALSDLKGARLQLKQQSLMSDTAFGYWTLNLAK